MSEAERLYVLNANKRYYEDCWDMAQRNFAPFPNAILVRGTVPETLSTVTIGRVAYLAIDVNIVYREVAAMEHFWDKLVPGGIVVFDDYGWLSHVLQKEALDAFAARKGVQILTLPTGQGLLIKPS